MTSSAAARILVVDDEPDLRTLYELTLLREGYQVDCTDTVASGRQLLAAQAYDVLITDMRLPDGNGLTLLHEALAPGRRERCLVITAHGSADSAVSALKAGAFDYLTKPIDLRRLRLCVASAIQQQPGQAAGASAASSLRQTPDAALDDDARAPAELARLVGQSPPMRTVRTRIARVSRSMAPVLIQGESGTGKELAARAVHACSHRAEGPFVAVNCGAIPESLLEAEFFGSRKGAYTGATHDRPGFFQAAHGGTLFLDEIGDLPLSMQAKLLRAIQERQVRVLGSPQETAVDVRIVSATHKDMALAVAEGLFRRDLYYRLNVIDITLPPLRDRREDIPMLARALLDRIAADSGVAPPALHDSLLNQLQQHPLRGNVRELENLLHRAMALGDGQALAASLEDDLQSVHDGPAAAVASPSAAASGPPVGTPSFAGAHSHAAGADPADAGPGARPFDPASGQPLADGELPKDLQAHLDAYEADIIGRALERHGFNRTATAASLGLSLRQIRYRIARLNIHVPGQDADNLTVQAIAALQAQGAEAPGDELEDLRLKPLPHAPGQD